MCLQIDAGATDSVRLTVRPRRAYPMSMISATEARKQLYSLLDEVAASHEPVRIVGRRNSAVLISEQDWPSIQETLHLLSIPGMRESIRKGLATPVDKCSEKRDW